MNDPIDKVFDTTYSFYLQSLQIAQQSYDYVRDKSSDVSSVINNQLGIRRRDSIPIPQRQSWSYEHRKAIIFSITGSALITAYLLSGLGSPKRRKSLRKANKLHNGARYETILIVGSPLNQSIQRLVNDLNQRGFIIYITVSSESELKVVEAEDSIDIRPLLISYESVKTVKEALNNFKTILLTPVLPFPNADEHFLNLKSVLIIPDYNHFPKGLIEEIPTLEWERVLNGQFLNVINLCYNGLFDLIRQNNMKKREIEKINKIYSEDDSDTEDDEFSEPTANTGGDTKLIFVNFFNTANRANQNFHAAEQVSILLKEKLYDTIYKDIKYMNKLDIPKHSSWLKRIFGPRLKSPRFINVSQLMIHYSPHLSSSRASESLYLMSSLESQYKLAQQSSSNFFVRLWWNFYNFLTKGTNQKISSTRMHRAIYDMIYSTKTLPRSRYISSRGKFYDSIKQQLTY